MVELKIEGTGWCKEYFDKRGLEECYFRLRVCIDTFTDENKNLFLQTLSRLMVFYERQSGERSEKEAKGDDVHSSVNSSYFVSFSHRVLQVLTETGDAAIFMFASHKIYSLLFSFLTKSSLFPGSLKIDAFHVLLKLYGPENYISDFTEQYSRLDTFYFVTKNDGKVCFRNYCLLEILSKVSDGLCKVVQREGDTGDLRECNDSFAFIQRLFGVPAFLAFLLSKSSYLVLVYAKIWLKLYEQDPQLSKETVARVFQKYVDIRKAVLAASDRSYEGLGCDTFGCVCRRCSAVVFKKLFFLFLGGRKKRVSGATKRELEVLGSCKVLRVFSEKEMRTIYRALRGRAAFINVFKQIDQRYLLKALKKDPSNQRLFSNIDPSSLCSTDLILYYKSYIKILSEQYNPADFLTGDGTSEEINRSICVWNLKAFSTAFNEEYDKSFVKKLKVYVSEAYYNTLLYGTDGKKGSGEDLYSQRERIDVGMSLSVSQMLLYYTMVHRRSFVDPVWITSFLFQANAGEFIKSSIPVLNNILWILNNIFEELPYSLKCRLLPILKGMVMARCFILSAGLLLSRYNLAGVETTLEKNLEEKRGDSTALYDMLGSLGSDIVVKHFRDPNRTVPTTAVVYSAFHFLKKNRVEELKATTAILRRSLEEDRQIQFLVLRLLEIAATDSEAGCLMLYGFASHNISLILQTCDDRNIRPIAVNVLMKLLRIRAIPPTTVIPYLSSVYSSVYLKRLYMDTIINTAYKAFSLAAGRIRREVKEALASDYDFHTLLECAVSTNLPVSDYISDKNIKVVMEKIEYDDPLIVYLFMRSLIYLSKESKETVEKYVQGRASDDIVRDLIFKCFEFYENKPTEALPVGFLRKGDVI